MELNIIGSDTIISSLKKRTISSSEITNPFDSLVKTDTIKNSIITETSKVDSAKGRVNKASQFPKESVRSINNKVNSKSDSVTNTVEDKIDDVSHRKIKVLDDKMPNKNINESIGISRYMSEPDAKPIQVQGDNLF